MTLNDTLKQCKKIIKARKKNKALYTKADIAYVKMIRDQEKKTLDKKTVQCYTKYYHTKDSKDRNPLRM